MPKKELAAVLIKEQHNVASNCTGYPLRLPRIMHEYVVLWKSVARPQLRRRRRFSRQLGLGLVCEVEWSG